jgi:hypothetical protein
MWPFAGKFSVSSTQPGIVSLFVTVPRTLPIFVAGLIYKGWRSFRNERGWGKVPHLKSLADLILHLSRPSMPSGYSE